MSPIPASTSQQDHDLLIVLAAGSRPGGGVESRHCEDLYPLGDAQFSIAAAGPSFDAIALETPTRIVGI